MAAKTGYDVVIADTVNHRLRGLSLTDGTVTTLVGSGVQRLLETGPARVDEDAAGFTGRLSDHPAGRGAELAVGRGVVRQAATPW